MNDHNCTHTLVCALTNPDNLSYAEKVAIGEVIAVLPVHDEKAATLGLDFPTPELVRNLSSMLPLSALELPE
jgi:hypothetical protein